MCHFLNCSFLDAYERDNETGLDFAQARYFSNIQGRFTSPDEPLADQFEDDPQSWNLYAFVRNNPCANTDPRGRETCYYSGGSKIGCEGDKRINVDVKAGTLTLTPKKGDTPIVYDLNKVDAQFISRAGAPTPQDFILQMDRQAEGTKQLIGITIGAGVAGGVGAGAGLAALSGGGGALASKIAAGSQITTFGLYRLGGFTLATYSQVARIVGNNNSLDGARNQGNRPITSRIRWFYVQDFKQIVSIPTGLQSLGLNAAFQCFFLL